MFKRVHLIAVLVTAVLVISACTDPAPEGPASAPSPSSSDQNKLQEILERGTLRVGTTGDFFMSFIDPETGER